MGEVTILVLSVLALGGWGVAGLFFNVGEKQRAAIAGLRHANERFSAELEVMTFERDELLRQKSLTQTAQKAQDVRKPLTSAQARARVDLDNRKFFSADKRIPNSEILKEHSNG